MAIRLTIILCLLAGALQAQVFGYQGRTWAVDAGVGLTPHPGLVSAMRYGEAKDEPSGLAFPYRLDVDFEKTIGLRSVINLGFSSYNLFLGFRTPETMNKPENDFRSGGFYVVNVDEFTANGYTLIPTQELRVNTKNYVVSAIDIDAGFKLYTNRYIAPVGQFFDLRLGASIVSFKDQSFEYSVYEFRTVPILPVLTDTVTESIESVNSKMFPFIRLGYGARAILGSTKHLYVEYNIFTSIAINTNKFKVESKLLNGEYSFESPNQEGLITGTAYAFLKKQKLFAVVLKLGYLF